MAIWGDDAMGSQGLTVLPQSSYNEREKACSVNSRQDAMMSVWINVTWEQGLDAGFGELINLALPANSWVVI